MTERDSYSRLNWSEERRLRRRTTIFVIVSFFLLISFFLWGLPTISNLIATVLSLSSANTTQTNANLPLPPQPLIFSPPIATNSTYLPIAGSAEANIKVEITVNNQLQTTVTSDKDGFFTVPKITLSDGQNSIQATAVNSSGGRSQPSQAVMATLDKTKLTITIDQPQDNQNFVGTRQQRLAVSGKLNKQAALTINQHFIFVSPDNTFSTTLILDQGNNTISAISTDSAGNTATKQLTVTFQP